jgi:hypothetical protein
MYLILLHRCRVHARRAGFHVELATVAGARERIQSSLLQLPQHVSREYEMYRHAAELALEAISSGEAYVLKLELANASYSFTKDPLFWDDLTALIALDPADSNPHAVVLVNPAESDSSGLEIDYEEDPRLRRLMARRQQRKSQRMNHSKAT